MHTHHTFELLVTAYDTECYGITSHSSYLGDAHHTMRLDLTADWLLDNLPLIEHGKTDAEALEHFGTQLFSGIQAAGYDGLFVGPILSHYRTCQGAALAQGMSLQVILCIQPPELEALPWELLFDPQDHCFLSLSPHGELIRTTSTLGMVPSLACPLPLAGLIVAGSAPDLALREEIETLLALGRRFPTMIQWEVLETPTQSALREVLASKPFHLLHYCGHGAREADQEVGVILAPEQWLDIRGLELLLRGHRDLRLVVLNACGTAQRNEHRVFSGAGERLLGAGIPAVIATRGFVSDESARLFARSFYHTLLEPSSHGRLSLAISRARKELRASASHGWKYFAHYSLYCRALDQQLMPSRPEVFRPGPASRMRLWAGVTLLLALLLMMLLGQHLSTASPCRAGSQQLEGAMLSPFVTLPPLPVLVVAPDSSLADGSFREQVAEIVTRAVEAGAPAVLLDMDFSLQNGPAGREALQKALTTAHQAHPDCPITALQSGGSGKTPLLPTCSADQPVACFDALLEGRFLPQESLSAPPWPMVNVCPDADPWIARVLSQLIIAHQQHRSLKAALREAIQQGCTPAWIQLRDLPSENDRPYEELTAESFLEQAREQGQSDLLKNRLVLVAELNSPADFHDVLLGDSNPTARRLSGASLLLHATRHLVAAALTPGAAPRPWSPTDICLQGG